VRRPWSPPPSRTRSVAPSFKPEPTRGPGPRGGTFTPKFSDRGVFLKLKKVRFAEDVAVSGGSRTQFTESEHQVHHGARPPGVDPDGRERKRRTGGRIEAKEGREDNVEQFSPTRPGLVAHTGHVPPTWTHSRPLLN